MESAYLNTTVIQQFTHLVLRCSESVSTDKALTNRDFTPDMKRRRLLALIGTVPLAGCGGMPQDATVKAERKPAVEETVDVVYSELPDEEQEIVRTGVEEKFYHTCPEIPKPVYSFARRLDSDEPYLEYQGTSYGLWVSIEDMHYAGTASPPEDTPNCGLL